MMAFQPDHIHFIATATLHKPSFTIERVEGWLTRLVRAVNMRILAGPIVCLCDDLGNEGVTGIVVLAESHSAIHIWDKKEDPYMKMDLYSCKGFSSKSVLDMIEELDPLLVQYQLLDRNHHDCGDLSLRHPMVLEEGIVEFSRQTPA